MPRVPAELREHVLAYLFDTTATFDFASSLVKPFTVELAPKGFRYNRYIWSQPFNCAVGVTAWTRFPLRLLTLQQTQRVADAVCVADLVRREQKDSRLSGSDIAGFGVGYFVGRGSTPNEIVDASRYRYANADDIATWAAANDAQQLQSNPLSLVLHADCPGRFRRRPGASSPSLHEAGMRIPRWADSHLCRRQRNLQVPPQRTRRDDRQTCRNRKPAEVRPAVRLHRRILPDAWLLQIEVLPEGM